VAAKRQRAAATNLRAVAADETAPETPSRKLTLTEAAAAGSLKEQLIALRERIAKAVDSPTCPPRDLAALSRRLIEIGRDIEAIKVAEAEEAGGATATPDEKFRAG